MVVRPVTFVILVALLAAAAGAGGWLAVRQNHADAAAEEAPARPTAASVSAAARESVAAPVAPPREAADAPTSIAPAPSLPAVREPEAAKEPAPAAAAAPVPAAPLPAADARPAPDADPAPDSEPAPDPEPAPDAVDLAAASNLPRVQGWVRRTERAAPADRDPPPIERLVIAADSVIGLQVETDVSSADAEVEDEVLARVTRDVLAGGRSALPAGTRVLGSVVLVEQAGKLRGKPRVGVRFHTAVMDDGAAVPLVTSTVYRDGPSRGGGSTERIGGAAAGGAILGAIFGGRRGAAIGSAAGAAGGTALAITREGPPATFQAGAAVTVRLLNPVAITVDRARPDGR